MWATLRLRATVLCFTLTATGRLASPQSPERDSASLINQFRDTNNVTEKEKILYRITQSGDHHAGEELLKLARTTEDDDTRWLAIRGLGMLKVMDAAPFLIESLESNKRYVKANAARALGELRYSAAAPALMRVLETEQDGGVIEQTSLALRMIRAVDAIPILKSNMSHGTPQTRCWLLDAIAELGSRDDVPFIAKYLYDSDGHIGGVPLPLCAARALAVLTGEDFGLPKGSGLFDGISPVLKARKWWEEAQR